MKLISQLDKQKVFLKKGLFDVKYRIQLLTKLKQVIYSNIDNLLTSYKQDFNKPSDEVYVAEILPIIKEINYFIKNTKKLSANKLIWPKFKNFFTSHSYISYKPYGSILIICSHDLILNSCFIPFIGAIAAGNTVFLKLPENSPNVNKYIKLILNNVFEEQHLFFLEDELTKETVDELYEMNFDSVFFLGKKSTSKSLIRNYSSKFIDITYQISNKCPIIVDETSDIYIAAKKIIWAKIFNSGQTPYSPDYVVVHESVYDYLLKELKNEYQRQYGYLDFRNDLTKIYKKDSYDKLTELINKYSDKVKFGGEYDQVTQSIGFTIINIDDLKSDLLSVDVHGPILPIIKYNNESDIYGIINVNDTSLATYIFSTNKLFMSNIKNNINSKTIIFNDVMTQIFYDIPLGGIRTSGNKSFGKSNSWNIFTYKTVVIKSSFLAWLHRFKIKKWDIQKIKSIYK